MLLQENLEQSLKSQMLYEQFESGFLTLIIYLVLGWLWSFLFLFLNKFIVFRKFAVEIS
jgi:hypothetical protein